ncbi:Lcl domain-containing protein [Vibrio metoecus]|uniref:Lcl domain-containing protein n=1 Tax=Vibrio metoecus TaxID=1481663 RepID=UPI000BA97D4E|nr:DUF1566 domain-containing protein [Vibrio metoecus]PAR35438.1 hypothetical protein CGT97_11030 [Vibrio metoecus]PAR44026.1 hypothetical protein CGT96_06615 [Vibrio metoecus]
MKFHNTLMYSALLLVGCGGGEETTDVSLPEYVVSGALVAQQIALNSKICLDHNQNFMCDDGELTTQADSDGRFTLRSVDKSLYSLPILAEISGSAARSTHPTSSRMVLAAPGLNRAGERVINGVSTLFAALMLAGYTEHDALTLFVGQLEQRGIVATRDLRSLLTDNALAQLEANMLDMLSLIEPELRPQVLAALAQTFGEEEPGIVHNALDDAQLTQYVALLAKRVPRQVPLNDTGLITFYEEGGVVGYVPNSDYPEQDAEYGRDAQLGKAGFTFSKLDAAGKRLSESASEWSCVRDEVTGLVWEVKSADPASTNDKERLFALEIPGRFSPYADDLAEATCRSAGDALCTTAQYIEHLNQTARCGIRQWRLPTNAELFNLFDFGDMGEDAQALSVAYFPQQSQNQDYSGHTWTSALSHTNYALSLSECVKNYKIISHLGLSKGELSILEVYNQDQAADAGSSLVLPVRMVADVVEVEE